MADHLNVFEPYERKGAGHEDALTRAFLLVLRGVPVAHAAWLDLVDQAHRRNDGDGVPGLHGHTVSRVLMQRASVPEGVKRVVSLVQTDEEVAVPKDASTSDRTQVLDGIVVYDRLAIVIENKPWHGNIWKEQLSINLPATVDHDPHVACVQWSDIVTAWGRLLEAGHLGCAEYLLIGDFLDYVETHFRGLRPYSRVALCGQDEDRLSRRCRAILEALVGEQYVQYHRGWGWYINLDDEQCAKKIGMFPRYVGDQLSLVVEIDPGDTLGQARLMYRHVELSDVVALLKKERWTGWPNFHLLFMTTGFFRPNNKMSLPVYWERWLQNRDCLRQWKRAAFDDAFTTLLKLGVVAEEERIVFYSHTRDTKRRVINFAPGATLHWTLPLDEAAVLDGRDQLVEAVRRAINDAARVFRLKLPT